MPDNLPGGGKTVHVPVVGNVPKGAMIAGLGAAGIVTVYLIYRAKKTGTAGTGTSAYGYGASAYGYGSAFYGYGSEFGSSSGGGSGYTPYPVGAEYGYGSYGYGYYNPYTGQWIGPTQQQPPTTISKGKGKWVTIHGRREYYNPNQNTLGYYQGTGKKRHWVKTKL